MKSDLLGEDHELFRETVSRFVRRHVEPNMDHWDRQRVIDRDLWHAAAKYGLLGLAVPEQYGGAGDLDYRFRFVIQEELAKAGAYALQASFAGNDDMALSYMLRHADDDQRSRWLPGFVSGDIICAIALTEPTAGSDLRGVRTTAIKDGRHWVLNGSKTFISNGISCDLAIVFAKTDDGAGSRGYSLLVIEDGMEGFSRCRKLDKVGMHAQDTAELFFDDVRVPRENLLGEEGEGFAYLMQSLPLERLSIAVTAQTSAEAVFASTLEYVMQREAFGQKVAEFQSVGFELASLVAAIEVSRAYIDRCVREHNCGTLTAVDAAKAKYWATEMQAKVIDAGVQMHGGYGYMMEYPVARAFIDTRAQRIYGGTSEIMKEIIRRDLLRS
jgi:alkylation response protein AidB-like acyl-CoA dehydrogenase